MSDGKQTGLTDIERKALALVHEVQAERLVEKSKTIMRQADSHEEALCRAIEAHEAFMREVSDAVASYFGPEGKADLRRFIIPKPDPLSEALVEALGILPLDDRERKALAEALARRGGKIVWETGDE